ncbi:hypothetical protein B0O80DRAFT_439798 [Mortierella sp. GBAus27b]|nr:hypothetical protein B0O80DRAFT_439798 [Mortierella sp. GBAus27b]
MGQVLRSVLVLLVTIPRVRLVRVLVLRLSLVLLLLLLLLISSFPALVRFIPIPTLLPRGGWLIISREGLVWGRTTCSSWSFLMGKDR